MDKEIKTDHKREPMTKPMENAVEPAEESVENSIENSIENSMDNRPIGIFDSGVGGLTVAAKVLEHLPNESIVYFGDTARVPYGNKSKETVTKFSKQIVRFLLTKDVKAIIVACNTSSSNCLEELQQTFDVPIFGVVGPGAIEAVRHTKRKRVGVIGTTATIRSGAYEAMIRERDPRIQVFSKACPLFVPLAEEGWTEGEVPELTIRKYLQELREKEIDALVLGCTHYPLLKKSIGKVLGPDITLVDPAQETSLAVKAYLERNRRLRRADTPPTHTFYVSDISEPFSHISSVALHHRFVPQKINIEEY